MRGAGRALLGRTLELATRQGLPTLGLLVTHGNPAIALYREHGFTKVRDDISVEVPGGP